MKSLMSIILFLFCSSTFAVDIDKNIISALNYINQGYIQYGCNELKKIAATNRIAAQYYIAVCYEQGIGVEKNLTQAFAMYRKAAERGLPDAMYHIAAFYKDGVVVSQDISREREWLNRYSQRGGKFVLPDILPIYQEGMKHPENYALDPNGDNSLANLISQGNKNDNSQKQTINNITIIQQSPIQDNDSLKNPEVKPIKKIVSDVDKDIPETGKEQNNTFRINNKRGPNQGRSIDYQKF